MVRCLTWTPSSPPAAYSRPVDWKLEQHVLQKASRLLQDELNAFATSIEEDEELLTLQLRLRTRFAVFYRLNVKETLRRQLQLLAQLTVLVEKLQEGGVATELCAEVTDPALTPYIGEIV